MITLTHWEPDWQCDQAWAAVEHRLRRLIHKSGLGWLARFPLSFHLECRSAREPAMIFVIIPGFGSRIIQKGGCPLLGGEAGRTLECACPGIRGSARNQLPVRVKASRTGRPLMPSGIGSPSTHRAVAAVS